MLVLSNDGVIVDGIDVFIMRIINLFYKSFINVSSFQRLSFFLNKKCVDFIMHVGGQF